MAELRARQSQWDHDYAAAAREAVTAADYAAKSNDSESWWEMRFLQADCLCADGELPEALEIIQELVTGKLARQDPGREGRALNLEAIVLQGLGRLREANNAVKRAVQLACGSEEDPVLWVKCQCTAIAVNAERGDLDAAWFACESLIRDMDPELPDDQLAAKAYWAIGNVAFLRDDIENGLEYHERAFLLFSPSKDLELWGKFNKGSAAMRLAAGIADAATLRCIERAEMSAEIVGGSTEDHLLLAVTRAHWNYLAGEYEEAIGVLEPVCELSASIASQNAAEAFYLYGRALFRAGRRAESLDNLDKAVEAFGRADAHDRKGTVEEFIRENF
ncbi:tetratricopeptide repeat protein [Spelaeicoccus albus]|uniref:Tetratricopeptide (TPR) repeat protein n=1 Tax=Spelaeicoccus albus TaxID=1280376 RepID=A0A7Z0D4S4_9MICO|nr:hypothetical protein [Spelaeicoccus albus]NYI68892.1 tetratricopeptide (TPR) repeat protein [Spelaeicoccus albus]